VGVRNVQRFRGRLVFKAHALLHHSTLGLRVIKKKKMPAEGQVGVDAVDARQEREFLIDNLLVRIHFIIVMIRWTGLAPWAFE